MTVKLWIAGLVGAFLLSLLFTVIVLSRFQNEKENLSPVSLIPTNSPTPTDTPSPTPTLPPVAVIPQRLHVYQTFNNCGPASLSMLLSYFDFDVSQKELGDKLRPYQVPNGNNDDKSVTLSELAWQAQNYGLAAYHRPNGTPELLKQLIAIDLPVVIRTLTKPNEDIGHYRVIRGYDDSTGEFVQDDSLQGKDIRYTYAYLNSLWQPYNFEYLALAPNDKVKVIEEILGDDIDEDAAWRNALSRVETLSRQDPYNIYHLFNISVAAYYIGDFQKSVDAFEKVELRLPFRTLWYQIEPIESYYKLGNYDRVLELTDKILNNYNRAFSELYYLRGLSNKELGNTTRARSEFEKAVYYNRNFLPARQELETL